MCMIVEHGGMDVTMASEKWELFWKWIDFLGTISIRLEFLQASTQVLVRQYW